MKNVFLFIITFSVLFYSCSKEGTGGKASISAYVKHHEKIIPAAVIYIKYDATEFPGKDISLYDDSVTTGLAGEEAGHVTITSLKTGQYYLYGIGYDKDIMLPVTGGIPVEIKFKDRNKTKEVTVPVTE